MSGTHADYCDYPACNCEELYEQGFNPGNTASTTAEITQAFPAAEKVEARDLRIGDQLFDSVGGTHEIVELTRRRGWVHTVRSDGWPDTFHQGDILTIIRGG